MIDVSKPQFQEDLIMKNPWFAFAGICSLVLGIVLFSVIFGGYSSFLRSQKRIDKAKELVVVQCRNQLEQIQKRVDLPGPSPQIRQTLLDAAKDAGKGVARMEQTDSPLTQDIISKFESAQVQLNDAINIFLQETEIKGNDTREQFNELQTAVFITGKKYNKAARYFNTRIQVFPGFIIARLFGLDKIYYPEISVDRLTPVNGKELAGAS